MTAARNSRRILRSALMVLLCAAFALSAAGCDRKIAGGKSDGKAIYASACQSCHGPGGVPPKAMEARLGVKNLTDPALHTRLSDADIRRQVLEGSANKKMPSFKGGLSDEQLDALVVFIRSLRRAPAPN